MKSIKAVEPKSRFALLALIALTFLSFSTFAQAKSARQIDIEVDAALKSFTLNVSGGQQFLNSARGVLVFPSVLKGGFVVGGEYGEGALLVGGKTVDYYNTASASIGFQLGAQAKTIIMVFMDDYALHKFRASDGWEAGVDGSVALVEWGAAKNLSTTKVQDPIIGFVFNNKGLMYNLTVEGSKFSKIRR
ncbi:MULTISPECIES: YSC84-related protein [Desulfosediminicola]|uniref:BPSL1445 family SYLF domain-containing lipoprotein n=1 Tax=Desulfosediminicola TaxID=2886823 RepID=UPI0010AC7ACC|nr:YSC84-related protein [Desulfosediminicola ganghwensis]